MGEAFGYSGLMAAAGQWTSQLFPILLFIGALALSLSIAGLGLALISGFRSGASGPSGVDRSTK